MERESENEMETGIIERLYHRDLGGCWGGGCWDADSLIKAY